jgi:molybdopterin-guanine dinucleotide biosynthesis protein A
MTGSVTGHDETLVKNPRRYAHLVAGLVLAGETASQLLKDKPLINHVVEKLQPQIDKIAISTLAGTDNPSASMPVILSTTECDEPMASILSALRIYCHIEDAPRWVLSVPYNIPFLPVNLVNRLTETVVHHSTMIAVAQSGENRHYDIALWPLSILDRLEAFVIQGGGSLEDFCEGQEVAWVHMQGPTIDDITLDPFFKVITEEDFETADAILDLLEDYDR